MYVELPDQNSDMKKAESFGVVESVKTASDVYAPVSGKIVESNTELSDEPAKVSIIVGPCFFHQSHVHIVFLRRRLSLILPAFRCVDCVTHSMGLL